MWLTVGNDLQTLDNNGSNIKSDDDGKISVAELFSVRGSQLSMRCGIERSRSTSSCLAQYSIYIDSTHNKMQSGHIFLPYGKYHFVVFRHSRADSTLSVFVDGHMECQFDFLYPFHVPSSGNAECQWIFGRNFFGRVSSIALYSKPLTVEMMKLMADLGPHM
jgi:hypothetical protein